MKYRRHKGISLVSNDRSPGMTTYRLSEIMYNPCRRFDAPVGFVMFEDTNDNPLLAIEFAPELEPFESFSMALGGTSLRALLRRTRPNIERLISNAQGIEPLLFSSEFGIPDALRFLPPREFSTDNVQDAVRRHSAELFRELNLFSEKFECRERRDYGYNFIRRKLRQAFFRLWQRRELEKRISIERFVPGIRSLRTIYLAYKNPSRRLFRLVHPVSIMKSAKAAEMLATYWPNIQNGLQGELGMTCEMHAIVESVNDAHRVAFKARRVMEDAGIVLGSVLSLDWLASDALQAFRSI